MAKHAPSRLPALAAMLASAWSGTGCGLGSDQAPGLSKQDEQPVIDLSGIPVPPADGPRLASIANATPIYARPSAESEEVGFLHAGSRVARSEEPVSTAGCAEGWYAVRPRGFVCADGSATTDLEHPTLVAMSIQPQLDKALPYTYARTTKATTLYGIDPDNDDAVVAKAKLQAHSGMAIVGSWTAKGPEGESLRLAMLPDGGFVPAQDLRQAKPSPFAGTELDEDRSLPLAYVVKRGVRSWKLDGQSVAKGPELGFHGMLALTGRYRTVEKVRFWATEDETWVRHRDVTALRRRDGFPDFVTKDLRWIDVSIITGTMVLYEGKRPVFATLVSTGRDRLGDPKETLSTARGTFEVTAKLVTGARLDPMEFSENAQIRDVPWVLKLSSGQHIHSAYWHDRFGIEHGTGDIALSPEDALRVWRWATPDLPEGWHGVAADAEGTKTIVHVRK